MSVVLWKKEWKSGWKLWVIFAAVLTMYSAIITGMYDPELGESLNLMMESMPELFAAFGMSDPGSTLVEFLINYLYGFLFVAIPVVFLLLLIWRVLLRYIDKGTLACLLATPNSRRTIAVTQILTMLSMLAVLAVYLTVLLYVLGETMFPGELKSGELVAANFGLLGLWIFLSGICWLAGCVIKETRAAMGTAGGLCILFLLIRMLADLGGDVEWMKYLTPLTLFDPLGLAKGSPEALAEMCGLYGVGLLCFLAGAAVFCRRDFSV